MSKEPVERQPCDGPMGAHRNDDGSITIEVTHNGRSQSITMGEFNARRVLATLSLLTELRLSKAAEKAIRL